MSAVYNLSYLEPVRASCIAAQQNAQSKKEISNAKTRMKAFNKVNVIIEKRADEIFSSSHSSKVGLEALRSGNSYEDFVSRMKNLADEGAFKLAVRILLESSAKKTSENPIGKKSVKRALIMAANRQSNTSREWDLHELAKSENLRILRKVAASFISMIESKLQNNNRLDELSEKWKSKFFPQEMVKYASWIKMKEPLPADFEEKVDKGSADDAVQLTAGVLVKIGYKASEEKRELNPIDKSIIRSSIAVGANKLLEEDKKELLEVQAHRLNVLIEGGQAFGQQLNTNASGWGAWVSSWWKS